MSKVLVALSGGVDSAVAAALLVEQGHEVTGVTMKLWSPPGCEQENRCCTPETRQVAADVAAKLGIPFTILDARDAFRESVVQSFLDGYAQGETPSPCVLCNRRIKWGFLLDHAAEYGADYVATGHYARIQQSPSGLYELWQGLDDSKDQAYMLSLLTQQHLAKTLFPLGERTKPQVREIAHRLGLPAADQPESQDLCFLGEKDYREFLLEYAPAVAHAGPIVSTSGRQLGEHQGLAFYTIGQRKGLPAATRPLYVLEKRMQDNTLIVGFAEELGKSEFTAGPINWISGTPPAAPIETDVKIRFKAAPVPAGVTHLPEGMVRVASGVSLRGVTPGQIAVFYAGRQILGGGPIRT